MTKRRTKKRERFYLLHAPSGRWIVAGPDFAIGCFTKRDALTFATRHARDRWERLRTPTQVLIQKKNGRWQEERTYGHDPRKTKG